ncbi:UNVERIFIED_CONTAM: hypothetical protein HDU68_005815 [Siphonaria sp. JEL0065]|nr:hypothetical protein HDU68_005815 [Siphonaria sp. JEL0065]
MTPEQLKQLTERREQQLAERHGQRRRSDGQQVQVPQPGVGLGIERTATSMGTASQAKPLFQRCIDLIGVLYSFPLFEFYLFPDGIAAYLNSEAQIAEPVDVLWNCFKLGAPLCVVFNELAATTTGAFLNPDDVSGIRAPFFPTKPCKDNLYRFINACHAEDLGLAAAKDLGGVSELYKDDTTGFMKFLRLVEDLVEKIRQANNMPAPKQLPFNTELSKDFANPVDNRSRLIKELVETERAYINSLEELQLYQNELAATKLFTKDMIAQLFSNLNEVLDFQRRFMVGMESTLNLSLVEQRIGQLFILNEDAFEVYFPFCGNYANAQTFAVAQQEELKQLGHIIQHHQIQSYLIKPLQRLMKYPLLLKELIKLTDPETYPYMEELKEGLESIKRVTEKLNEIQRRDENERNKSDLAERMEDWKGLQIRDFGELLLMERFWIASNDQEREYYLFLFERILLCCKKDLKQNKRVSNRKRSDAGKETGTSYAYILRGNIYISSIVRVEDSSDPSLGAFSIRVYWKEASEPETVCFSLKCRNEEQVTLWTGRLEKQVAIHNHRKNSTPRAGFNPIMPSRSSDGYSSVTAYDGNSGYNPSINGSMYSNSGSFSGGLPQMMRSPSNPSSVGTYYYNNNFGQQGMMSPMSPGYPQAPQQQFGLARQNSYDQQQYYMDNGVMMQMPNRPPSGQGVRSSQDQRRGPQAFGYSTPPVPLSPANNYITGPDGRPMPPSRLDSMSSAPIAPRQASIKRNDVGSSSSKSRDALNALANLAASGLPIAGFSDDEDDDDDEITGDIGVDEVSDEVAIRQQMAGMQMYGGRKQSVANGMMMGAIDARRPSADRGYGLDGSTGMRKTYSEGQQPPQNVRYSPQPIARKPGFPGDRNSPNSVALAQNFQFPPPQQHQQQTSGLQEQLQRRSGARQVSPSDPSSPYAMRRTPTAPTYGNTPATSIPLTTPSPSSSFIKIRAHYDGDILIIAMPIRGATLQELRNRVERKATMMPNKPILSNPINLVVKEEVAVDGVVGGKEWRPVGVLETDEDVARAFNTHSGLLNLFLS